MSDAIERFEIRVPDEVLDDLRARLARTRFPDQLEDAGWDYGTELSYLRELVAYWRDKYDWRAAEQRLNGFEHFRTEIDGQGVHFMQRRSPRADALPLCLVHGWPGSVFEFTKVADDLAEPPGADDPAFHVICPSLPGYGFSGPTRTRGWDVRRVAETFAKLMARLGHDRYGAQGGDWGAIVTTWLGLLDAPHLAGIHLNMVVALPPAGTENPLEGLTPEEIQAFASMGEFQKNETGYQQIQGTKPQTLGYALNDSPAGLAAWIVEKFRTWSDCDGDVEKRFTKDELLTNITIYWATQTINSSIRLYCESMRSGQFGVAAEKVRVPTGCAIFPKEIFRPPRRWAEAAYDVRHWTEMPRGGHFAALEEPELFTRDVRAFFGALS